MTEVTNLLLVGSLPPQPSHAALLTQLIAELVSSNGTNVTCLIDDLAPPPAKGPAYDVIRPFTPDFRAGKYDNWPRLYVIGGDGGSLMTLKMLHASPGPAILAEYSLFPLVSPWLQQTADHDQTLYNWLTSAFDQEGATLARGIVRHRRNSTAIGGEVSGVDLLLAPATNVITVGDHLASSGEQSSATIIDPLGPASRTPLDKSEAESFEPRKKLKALVIGSSEQQKEDLSQKTSSSAFGANLSVTCANRFSRNLHSLITDADAVAILDGQQTPFCPHAHRAMTSGKAVICAGQKWSNAYPAGSFLPINHPDAVDQLAMTLGALASTDGLFDALLENAAAPLPPGRGQQFNWYETLLDASATATPISHPETPKLHNLIEKHKGTHQPEPMPDAGNVLALVGAVPAKPILEKQFSDLRYQSCPRFMTPELAATLSALMDRPQSRLLDDMGFEASLVAATRSLPNTYPDKKIRSWRGIQRGLRRAETGVTFGCSVEGLSPAPSATGLPSIGWEFRTIFPIDKPTPINSGYDARAGVYWVFDSACNALCLLLFTGGAGNLALTPSGTTPLVVSDRSMTTVISDRKPVTLSIADHGIAYFKLAAAPDETGNSVELMKTLAEQGLYLEWSAL